jgi:hypothetical protein
MRQSRWRSHIESGVINEWTHRKETIMNATVSGPDQTPLQQVAW